MRSSRLCTLSTVTLLAALSAASARAQEADTKISEPDKNSAATVLHSAIDNCTGLGILLPILAIVRADHSQEWVESDANSPISQAVEKRALEVLATAPVRQAVAQGLKTLEASDAASKPEALRFVRSALEETAMFASLNAAMGASPEPSFIWLYAAPRRWNGYTLPGSRWYADNVDTFYRALRVDENSAYEINVRVGATLPSQLTFMVYNWLQHDGTDPRNDVPLGTLTITEDTPRNPDGTITLTAGLEPANGRLNYLQLKPGAKQVLAREIRGDGSLPAVRLAVKRTRGTAKVKSLEALAEEAAGLIASGVKATVNISVGFGQLAENQPGELRVRWIEETGSKDQKLSTDEPLGPDRALGFLTSFLFNLREDEALVLTLNMLGAQYLSINSYRPFILSPEHVHRTSSLNNYQTKKNPDGSITFVFARTDPGVYNWIDSGGIPYGVVAVRWQTLTQPVSGTLKNAMQVIKVVKIADLRQELPPTTFWVTPEQRAEQRAARAKQFLLRSLGTPCEAGGELDKPY